MGWGRRSEVPGRVAEAGSGIDQLLEADFLGATAITDVNRAAEAILLALRASHRAGDHATAGAPPPLPPSPSPRQFTSPRVPVLLSGVRCFTTAASGWKGRGICSHAVQLFWNERRWEGARAGCLLL